MSTCPNFGISEVEYDPDRILITHIKQHGIINKNAADGDIVDRMTIIDNIEQNMTYKTMTWSGTTWDLHKDIKIVRINSTVYIRTDNNNIPKDDLGELPEF